MEVIFRVCVAHQSTDDNVYVLSFII